MKRYWKLAVLVPFIILCIGTYYVEASGGNGPEYYLKLLAGNEKEASQVSLQANYRNEELFINPEGSEYRKEQSFWESLSPNYYSKELEKLVKVNRQFMRGKTDLNGFYEDDQFIGYVDIRSLGLVKDRFNAPFTVSLYDKKRKGSSSFEVSLPKVNIYNFINLHDVQIDGQTMKLVTINFKKSESNAGYNMYPEVHLYTLDLDKKNIVEDQVIFSEAPLDENNRVNIMGVDETDPLKQSRYAVFQTIHSKKVKAKESSEAYVPDHRELFVYDLKSGKPVTIQDELINEILKGTDEQDISHSGDELYLTSWTDQKGAHVIRYSLAENKVEKDLTIAFNQHQSVAGKVSISRIANNRLYMLVNMRKGESTVPTVVIAELDTGGIVYQGEVSRKDNKELSNLMIDNIIIK
jgi:hypothetical protein